MFDRALGAYFDRVKEKRKIQEKLRVAISKEEINEVKSIVAVYRHMLTTEQHNNAVIWIAQKEGLYSTEATEIEEIR